MASLVGEQLKNTYDSLLKTSDNDALGGTYKEITDGSGNGSNLYLGTSGSVGIGSAPTSLLQLEQSIVPRITLIKTGVLSWYLGNVLQGSDNNFTIGTDSGGNTNILTLDTSGNVGIGVTPSATLHIDNPANPTSLRIGNNTADDCFIMFNTDGNDWAIGADRSASNSFKISDNSTLGTADRLVIDTSGTIKGIGTYTASGSIKIFEAERSGGAVASDWSYDDASTDMSLGTSTAHSFSLKTGNTNRLTIDSSGIVQARRARSNTAGNVALSLQPSDSTIHYGFRIDSANNFLNIDRVDSAGTIMTLDPSGNVGIGGTPASISGDASWLTLDANDGSTASGGIIHQINGTTKGAQYVYANNVYHDAKSGIGHQFAVNGGSTAMTIDTSKRVGIGDIPKTQHSNVTHSLNVGSHLTFQRTKDTYIASNFYYNSSDVGKSIASGWSPVYQQDVVNGKHIWYNSTASATGADETVSVNPLMTIDSSGNVLVGKQTSSITTVGVELKADGNLIATRAGVVTTLNREDSDGTIIDLRKDGTTVGGIGTIGGDLYFADATYGGIKPLGDAYAIVPSTNSGADYDNAMSLGASSIRWKDLYLSGTAYLQEKITTASSNLKIGVDGSATSSINISSASLYPQTDGSMNLGFGASSFRFATVFATTGTINTSDEKQKQDIEELSEAELRVAQKAKTLMKKYRMISSVEEKGDDARIHVGIIAQDLEKAFADEGLDAGRYGMFIKETTTNDNGEEQTAYAIRYNELLAFIISSI